MTAREGPGRTGSLLRRGAAPLVIGHRGASAEAPENTLPAFRACWAAGIDWVEADVQPTADLVPVLLHDDTLDRTTNGTGSVRVQELGALGALDAGSWFTADFVGTRVPTLHAVLTELPPTGRLLLEIKGPHTPPQLVATLAVIRATGTHSRVWLQSFEEDALDELRSALPSHWLGLLRERLDDDPLAACARFGASSYNVDYEALLARPTVVSQLHDAGISVLVFTPDDDDDWAALTAIGVDGIITNRPAELLRWLHATATRC